MLIIVSGLTASGKSTLAKSLAKRFNLEYVSGSKLLRKFGNKDVDTPSWWSREEGLKFIQERQQLDLDKKVDEYLLSLAKEGNKVIDSWTLSWLCDKGLKIRLKADFETRAERLAKRDDHTLEKAREILKEKDRVSAMLYKKLYNIDIMNDLTPFHLVLDTTNLTIEEVEKIAEKYVSFFFKLS